MNRLTRCSAYMLDTKVGENKAVGDKVGGVALRLVQGFQREEGECGKILPRTTQYMGSPSFPLIRPVDWMTLSDL